MASFIDTDRFSENLRLRSIKPNESKLLVSNFRGTEQEDDFSESSNCGGYGRIRHFRRQTSPGWPSNPLPIDPASKALGIPTADVLRAQVFQNASCNWRCWYCYVPYLLLNANEQLSGWLSAADLVDLYLNCESRPKIIDLSGGQPDLVPEWILWMMRELVSRGLESEVYLWSDDNLSNDYFWRFLSDQNREQIASYRNYGKVCCFKGFNPESFAFNTRAVPELFERQFALMRRYLESNLDVYGYVTLTTPRKEAIHDDIKRFVDALQDIHPYLPLRVVPLEITTFKLVTSRMNELHYQSMHNQWMAVEAWHEELRVRFTEAERSRNIADAPLKEWSRRLNEQCG